MVFAHFEALIQSQPTLFSPKRALCLVHLRHLLGTQSQPTLFSPNLALAMPLPTHLNCGAGGLQLDANDGVLRCHGVQVQRSQLHYERVGSAVGVSGACHGLRERYRAGVGSVKRTGVRDG